MAIFKCKMCGASLEVDGTKTVAECDYCGTTQTIPTAMDENLQNLFNRANTLRIKNEFDKAEKLYEKIIQVDASQSDAYWGLILCKYGIEYVDDPKTFKKIPTCHRTSYDSIIADDDYKSAIEHADASQRAIYEEQAKEIDGIQKDILALAQKEESYDVFICYKETDADGKRTQDSVIANDIYYQLTQEGFKVFYAAITLEGKLGSAYEPIIFAALNSAKVMLSIGTNPEYFNAVWVKNEWSRFLKIIQKDRSKLLIPCYRDMNAYELPEEFAHLQAQDMAKIGFINDLVRGIKKVIKKDEPKSTPAKETIPESTNTNIAPLLKRAFMFLEDGDWNSANEYCEKVLDIDPENAQAYLGKLMAELKVKKQEQLKNNAEPFDKSNNYQKVFRFGNEALKSEIEGYIEYINTRNEAARLEDIYHSARELMEVGNEKSFLEAAKKFSTIPQYKDSQMLVDECKNKAETARLEDIYNRASTTMRGAKKNEAMYRNAANLFKSIGVYKDADSLAEKCLEQAEIARIEKGKRAKLVKKISAICAAAAAVVLLFVIVLNSVIIPTINYNSAVSLMNEGKYTAAIHEFKALDGYKDSEGKINECHTAILDDKYNTALALMDEGAYEGAISAFEELDGYKDSAEKILECKYNSAVSLMNAGILDKASLIFDKLKGYKDSDNKITECNEMLFEDDYKQAVALMTEGKHTEALEVFRNINGYKDSAEKIEECLSFCVLEMKFDENTQEYTVNKYTGDGSSISIPATFNNYPVTAIGKYAFQNCKKLVSITLPEGIKAIGDRAFEGCSSLLSIEIPNSVTSIGAYAFSNCSNLSSNVVVPSGVTTIEAGTFLGCKKLSSIVLPNSITSISTAAFSMCTLLSSINIPSGVTKIAPTTFYECESLVSITIPAGVTKIGHSAFQSCKRLSQIIIPEKVDTIGRNAFEGCVSLLSITFEKNYTWKGYAQFQEKTIYWTPSTPQENARYLSEEPYYIDAWTRK